MSKFHVKIAANCRDWYGRKVPEGAAYGTEWIPSPDEGIEKIYDYIFEGDVRTLYNPDGSVKGRAVKLYVHHHRYEWRDNCKGIYRPMWAECRRGSLAEKLLNKHIKPNFESLKSHGTKDFKVYDLQSFSSAIKRPSSAGAIFNMVRERQ